MIDDHLTFKLGRPRQLYIGKTRRAYQNMEKRSKKSMFNWLWNKKERINY